MSASGVFRSDDRELEQMWTDVNTSEDVIVTPAVSDEDAEARFGGFDRVLPYLRKTKMPTD